MRMNRETAKKLNDRMVEIFNGVLEIEGQVLQRASAHNLSVTEIHTLDAIGIGKTKTMTQVASALRISISTLTIAMGRLEKKGFVRRFRVEEDRRIVKVELTDIGRDAVLEHENFHLEMVADAVKDLSQEEQTLLLQSLDNISAFFQRKKIRTIRDPKLVKLEPLYLGELKIPVPIFQGGMGIGISLDRLAAAVSACGGVGMVSAAQCGFQEDDFYTDPLAANVRALKRTVSAARKRVEGLADRGPIGVNIMCVGNHYDQLVKAAVEAGAELIISGAGLPTSLPACCPDRRIKLIPIVSSARAASIIMKNWSKKFDRIPDALIFEGPLAGGHLGFKESQLEEAQEHFYQTISAIRQAAADYGGVPVIAAGGIYTQEDVKRALACGADGVQLATRFVTTEECDAHPRFKEAYLDCGKEDIVILHSPVGMPGRAIENDFVRRTRQERIPPERCNRCMSVCKASETPYCITKALIDAALGDVKQGLVFCGSNAYRAERIETVKEVFDELTGGC